jgi:DNA (cytosine-5)-methyltransferase 1
MPSIYNHISPKLSTLESEMAKHIPQGGNWQNIPLHIPSQRLTQIRASGGRTTYYGRLSLDQPAYTITTYFNRLGNSSNLHPTQERMISIREGARLQSFDDNYIFHGSKSSQYKQIGNAVPPLLARAIAETLKPYLQNHTFVDLFSGAGGMSKGFLMEDYKVIAANEIEKNFFETYIKNHNHYLPASHLILGDITDSDVKQQIINTANSLSQVGLIMGGPPCQGFSTAGWRNPDDVRNQLFKDFVAIVDQIRPEAFVLENVQGILTMRNGEVLQEIKDSFSEIGYYIQNPFKLNADDFGVPQKRKRVFIIGTLNKVTIPAPQPLFSSKDDKLPNPITVKEAILGLPTLATNSGTFELITDYSATSPYESLIMNEIDFATFYQMCL